MIVGLQEFFKAWSNLSGMVQQLTIRGTKLVPHCGILQIVDDGTEITVLQLPKFKAEATDLIGTDGIEAVALFLIDHPDAGDVIPGARGARKLRWAAKGKAKRGGARILYLYVVIAARIYRLRSASAKPAPIRFCRAGEPGPVSYPRSGPLRRLSSSAAVWLRDG